MARFALKLGDVLVAGFADCAVGDPVLALDPGNRDWIAAPHQRGGRDPTHWRAGTTHEDHTPKSVQVAKGRNT